jgi:cellulose synthase/poly-beta-1,6-N-acetylglucosamine synthase-like glycosyltransferase
VLDATGLALAVLLAVAAVPAAASAAYLLALSVASFFYRRRPTEGEPTNRMIILVPAHDEAQLVGRCVRSLIDQAYPAGLFRVCVIADNCTDTTAAIARGSGAEVMVRTEPEAPGKGRALRWAMDRILAEPSPPDALVIVDADSVADVDLLTRLEGELRRGHEVVQGECVVRPESGSRRESLQAAAVALRLDVRFSGRAVLQMPAVLAGNGMLFSRRILTVQPWGAFTSVEDAEYGMALRLNGVKTAYARGARVYTPPATTETGAYTQSLRWDGGRFVLIRTWLRPMLVTMLGRGDWSLADTIIDLALPPLGMLAFATILGTVVSVLFVRGGLIPVWIGVLWASSAIGLAAGVVLGLVSARAPGSAYLALLLAPQFLVLKLRIYTRLLRGFDPYRWVRTER